MNNIFVPFEWTMLDTGFSPPVTPPRHADMRKDLLQIIWSYEKACIEKQALDQAKRELEHECSWADAFISTFGEPGATGGHLPPNTES